MNWDRYIEIKRDLSRRNQKFVPENQTEAKQALALGVIDIGQYVEFSLTTEPLLDSIHDPDPQIRKEAIRKIAEQKNPFSVKMLHGMLMDTDEEVRLYAASELDRLENEKQKEIHHLRKQYQRNTESLPIQLRLAQTYIDYARVLLLGNNLRSFFLQKGMNLLGKVIAKSPNHSQAYYLRGLAHKFMGQNSQALNDLKKTVQLNSRHIAAYLAMAEIYFQLHRFDIIKQIMTALPVPTHEVEAYNAKLLWRHESSQV